nr:hypothetical protein [Neobacillus sp. Marseille-Q6967]
MIDRQMIEQIVNEVIKQLTVTENKQKPKLLVIGEPLYIEPHLLEKMHEKWNVQDTHSFSMKDIHKLDQVIFLHVTQDLLVKGALGIFDTDESKWLSRCMMESIPVSLIPTAYLQEQLLEGKSKNAAYVEHLLGYKDSLEKFGVKLETFESFVNNVKAGTLADSAPFAKKLLTQKDVEDSKHAQIVVDKTTIITPLARDTARAMGKNIKVIESKGAKA